ncbi:MAG: TolC family protein, partial [Bryobacteraceae bacterium]
RNRGSYVNHIPLMVARSRVRKSEYDLRDTLLRLLQTSELAYWRAIELRENLRVQESALSLADQTLKRSQRELELGAISRLDIYQPEFQFAQAEGNVSQSRFSVLQQDDTLRKQMGADLDPEIRKLPLVLTESPAPPPGDLTIDPELEVEKALAVRPDLKSAVQDLDVDDLTVKAIRNQLRPDLSLTGGYTSQGRGGTGYIRENVFTDIGSRSTITQVLPGGFGDSLDQLFGFGFPVYSFGLRLRLPIRNRQSHADLADALINKRRDALQARNTEQQIRLEVVQAVSQVESSKASVTLAIKARDFAQKRLDAEQKKYELGTSQIFLVLQAQTDLIGAESNVVRESVNFRRNELNLLRTTGELLSERGVTIQ